MNQINNLITDLNNDSTLLTQFQTFCNTLANNITTNLTSFCCSNSINRNVLTWLNTNLQNMIQNNLSYWTYAYESSTLISWWTNNVFQLATNISVNFGLWFMNWLNAFNLASSYQIISQIVENNLSNQTTNNTSTYKVESALNSDSNLTIQNINDNSTVNNETMNQDTTPLKQSNADFNSNQTNDLQGVNIANFLQTNFQPFQQKFEQVLYDTFKVYLLPFNNLDNSTRGFNW